MSGVAKDDITPNSPADEAVSKVENEAGKAVSPASEALPPLFNDPAFKDHAKETAAREHAAREHAAKDQPAKDHAKDDAEPRSRRPAPHLRVVSDTDADAAPVHQRIGDEIRAARENTGFTLEQVSRETRVHISHLRAIEEMTPGLLGAPVYAKGYIKAYARFLGMDEQTTLDRYLSECAAILKDPEKVEIAQPASSKARKLPVAVPVLGILVVALVGGAAAVLLSGGDKSRAVITDTAGADANGGVTSEPVAPQLRVVALKRSHLIVRSANGTKFVDRDFYTDEFYAPRVGSGWTVTADDGAAFEWRLGDQSLGLLQPEGGPVYSQNVDMAAQRQPIVTGPAPIDPASLPPTSLTPNGDPAVTPANPANPAPATPAKPKPPKPATPAPSTNTAPAPTPKPAEPAPPAHDPALDAYPDQVPQPPAGQ